MKMKKWMYNALIIFFAAVLVVSAGYLAYYFIDGWTQNHRYAELGNLKETVTPRPSVPQDDTVVEEPATQQFTEVTDPETGETVKLLPEFAELYLQNNDIVGWITIPGTDIDYPVMQTPESPDYYLRRSFDKKRSTRGCIYVRETCDVFTPGDNLTIYGHRMKDGSMFAMLHEYMDEDYYRAHPTIIFNTLTEYHTYEIVSVFLTTATVGQGFHYHEFVDAANATEFDVFVGRCKDLALYNTGVDASYGDKLITLSTCEYSQTNGRLVVVAKRIS